MMTRHNRPMDANTPTHQAWYLVRRTLILSQGADAQAVASGAMQHGTAWMADAMPASHVSLTVGRRDEAEEAIINQLSRLVDQILAGQMASRGYAFEEHDELHLWLVHSGDDAEDSDRLEEMMRPVTTTIDQAWKRNRLQTITHLLLCGLPCNEAQLFRTYQHLCQLNFASAYLVGPINEQHTCLDAAQWHDSAAAAMAMLIFGRLPSHTLMQNDAKGLYALGGAFWTSPRTKILRWLAYNTTAEICRCISNQLSNACKDQGHFEPKRSLSHSQGLANQTGPPNSKDNRPPLLPSVDTLSTNLSAALAPRSRARHWSEYRVRWSSLSGLVERWVETERSRSTAEQYRMRRQRATWLEDQVKEWDRWVKQKGRDHLSTKGGEVQLGDLKRQLDTILATLQTDLEHLEADLELLERRHAAAHAKLNAAEESLQSIIDRLPHYSLRGAVTAFVQPWMWPAWLWQAYRRLPKRGEVFLSAQARLRQVERQESNCHLLRQLRLAQQTDVSFMLNRLDRLHAYLGACVQALEEECQQIGASISTPWSEQRIHELWHDQVSGKLNAAVTQVADVKAFLDWPDLSQQELVQLVVRSIQDALQEVRVWHAADALIAASIDLPASTGITLADGQEASSLLTLPNQTREQLALLHTSALPLWPRSLENNEDESEHWLVLPPAKGLVNSARNPRTTSTTSRTAGLSRGDGMETKAGLGYDAVRRWCEEETTDSLASCPGDIVGVLSMRAVFLNGGKEAT